MNQPDVTSWKLDTIFVQGNEHRRTIASTGTPTVQPIYASTTYLHRDAATLDQAFTPDEDGAYVYARHGNPNAHALETLLTQVEGGVGAVTFSSGMAATHAALLAAGLAPGSKILVAQDLYGPTRRLLQTIFLPVGVAVVLGNLCNSDAADLIRAEEPDVIFVETLSNPLVKVTDLDAISTAAQEVGAVTIVDNTFATPYLLRPIKHGFDLVVHSATKYMGGHGDSTAGAAISARKALLDQLRTYAIMLGAMLSPFESHAIRRGLRTLHLRMERHCSNALEVAHFLQQHPAVERVHYPGLPGHPQHELATRLLGQGRYGGLLAFELKEQSREATFRFMDKLQLCLPATTLGDVFSLVSYPPTSSHRDLTLAELQKMGITEGCIRLSVGIEDLRDIIDDLDQALRD